MLFTVSDSFTDSGIAGKSNGQTNEPDMKELQPWHCDEGEDMPELGDTNLVCITNEHVVIFVCFAVMDTIAELNTKIPIN